MISCIAIDDDDVFLALIESMISTHPDVNLIGSFDSLGSAQHVLASGRVDLVLLDIEMPGETGLEYLGSGGKLPQVILVTAHREYAAEAFEYDVTDYVVKPVQSDRFEDAIARAVRINGYQKLEANDAGLLFKSGNKNVRARRRDISGAEAYGDYLHLYERGNQHLIFGTLNDMQATLGDSEFMRIHRKHLVRLDAVQSVDGTDVELKDGRTVQVSRRLKRELLARLG